jgi:phospholipid/cholesterol/gamma-HCH transport system substrate-binding protein
MIRFLKSKITRELKVGIVFVVAISVAIWGMMYLKGLDLFKTKRTFYAQYDYVNGLVPANPVFIKGMKVGQVKELYFSKKDPRKIIVEILIEIDYPIPANSIARIVSTGLIGAKEIEIDLGDSEIELKQGDTIRALTDASFGEQVQRQLVPLTKKAEDLISSIDSIAIIVKELLNQDTRNNLFEAINHVQEALENLAHTTYNIDTLVDTQRRNLSSIISNVESISTNLRQNNGKITNILTNFSNISDSLARTDIPAVLNNVNKTITDLDQVIGKINRGEGSIGLLLNDKKLYDEVTKAAKDLNLLLEDIRANPSKYVKVSVF